MRIRQYPYSNKVRTTAKKHATSITSTYVRLLRSVQPLSPPRMYDCQEACNLYPLHVRTTAKKRATSIPSTYVRLLRSVQPLSPPRMYDC
ncbi:hypothetical protein DPMN_030528 [Dreissena polymorpha]|uniref:Uncharacterized protein n=1 Tax=Dreissena polymorpha TaxID=45954 RepID=A0A9D4M1A7_DREPO|nr:hypothetical protein DPMN_030528 [Dreissena polymorpha]